VCRQAACEQDECYYHQSDDRTNGQAQEERELFLAGPELIYPSSEFPALFFS
jgi:hypothetical protein